MEWLVSTVFLLVLVAVVLATARLADPEFAARMHQAWVRSRRRRFSGLVRRGRSVRRPGAVLRRKANLPLAGD